MEKREFIKSLSFAALGAPFYGSTFASVMGNATNISPEKLATTEDFWQKVRADYKLNPDYINLESGYYNIIPTPTLKALQKNIEMVNYHGAYYMRTVQFDNKKRMVEKLAKVVGAPAKNLIITRNTTESLNMIIGGMNWESGDEAIYAVQDYGSMKLMFEQISMRYGTINKIVSIPNHPNSDEEIVALYENAITPKTKLLMVCHIINITGHILPIKKICAMARTKGVKVLVDGAHSIGHFEFNITDLDCDFYGSSLHKWLAVPLGTGLLYVADKQIDTIWPLFPEEETELGDISRLNHTGTIPVYHDLTIENAIDYYNMLGGARKEARLRFLQEYWTKTVRGIYNVTVNTPAESHRACAIANVGVEGMKSAELAKKLLDDYKIYTVAINTETVKGCRITPNVFTTVEELDVLVRALTEITR